MTELYMEGKSCAIIAGRLGRSRQSVYKKLDKLALKVQRDKRKGQVNKGAVMKSALLSDVVEKNELTVQGGHEEYNEVLGKESAHALARAFEKVRTAESASDLNTALGAAQKADVLYRKANGLDMGGSVGTINFYMAGRDSSPLRTKAKAAEVVTDV